MAGRLIPFEKAIHDLCRKNKVDFRTAVEAVLDTFQFADWAILARAVDGNKIGWWEAGEGETPIGDRERAMLLIGELEDLKSSIIEYYRSKQTSK